MVKEPLRAPGSVAEKRTATDCDAPGETVTAAVGDRTANRENGPSVTWTWVTLRAEPPALRIVRLSSLVCPMATDPKASEVGDTSMEGA